MRPLVYLVGLLLLEACATLSAFAQTRIDGQVVDAETALPLAGVNVLAEGTALGTVTDLDGRFVLEADAPLERLVFSFIGFEARVVSLAEAELPLLVELHPRLLDLQTVIVSASRVEERRTESPVAIAALSASELNAKKPDQLHEVLSTLPGVHMTSLGNEQHVMSIRQPLSYGAVYAYLEDGIPIRPTGIFNHNALIEVNMEGVDRIEVIRGPASSLYGPNAIGGAINFITARPSPSAEMELGIRSDSYGYRRGDFAASSTFGRLGVWAGGYVARQRDGWAEHSDFDKVSLTLRSDYAFAPATRLSTTLSTSYLNTDTNGNLDSLSFFGEAFTSLQTFTRRKVVAVRAASRLDHVWNSRQSSQLALYWRDNAIEQLPHYRIRNDRTDASRARGELNEDAFWTIGVNAQHRLHFEWMSSRLIVGAAADRSPNTFVAHFLDVERDPATGRYVDYSVRDSLLTDYRVDLLNAGSYVQLETSPLARLKLVGSLRYDLIRYRYDNFLPPTAFSGAPDETNTFRRMSPRFGVTVDAGRGLGLYGNISRGFVPPEVNELYRGVKVPILQPALFTSFEVGGWWQLLNGRVHTDVSLYRMEGTNEIIDVLLDDGSTENRNAGRTRHVGVEYMVAVAPLRSLTLRIAGTNALHEFIRFEDRGEALDGNEMDAAPRWMAHGEITYRPPFLAGLRLGVEWEHVGAYFMDPQNTLRYGGYDLFTVRTTYATGPLEFWVNVHNVTDELYANIASKGGNGQAYNPGGPRRVGAGVGYRW